MKRLRVGPITQIAMALALMACMLVLVASALLKVFGGGDDADERTRARRALADSIALYGAGLVQRGEADALQTLLRDVVAREPRIESIVLRRASGAIVAQAGDTPRSARPGGAADEASDDADRGDRIKVPLFASKVHWGDLELAYRDTRTGPLPGWLGDPTVTTALFVFVVGSLGFGLFMRRVLQHLDPAAAVPERVRVAFDTLVEGITILDAEGRIVLTNQAFRSLRADVDIRDGTVLSSLSWHLTDPESDPLHPWARAMNTSQIVTSVGMRVGEGDEARDVLVTGSPIRDGRGEVRGCLVSFADVTEVGRANTRLRGALSELERSRAEIEAKNLALQRAATRDPLTDCLNRRAFAEMGEPLLARALGPHGRPAAALLLDIDHFKSVNDRFGHAVGDRVIRTVAATLREEMRPGDLVARHGGEEFAVLMPDCAVGDAAVVADRVRRRIAERCLEHLSDLPTLQVTVSVGVSDSTLGAPTLDGLLDQADTALYRAKRSGRNRVLVHDPAATAAEAVAARTDADHTVGEI
jgi:diguanylate cyclase (GGDEF)-like protein